jgi:site-specific recombinase XerD
MNHLLSTFMKRFFSYYLPIQKGLAVNTILAYRDAIKLLLCYAADTLGKTPDELAVEDTNETLVLGFLDHVEQGRGCSARTRNSRLTAVRSLFAFIAREEPALLEQCQQIRAIPLKRTEHRQVPYLEENEMQAVLDAVDINSRTGIRDRALLLLLYNTGARVSEIVDLKLPDLRLTGSNAQVRLMGKGKKERSCPLWPETVAAVEAFLKQREPKEKNVEQVFLNANGYPISRFGIRHVTRKHGVKAQAQQPSITKTVNPHVIRHTTAMHLLRAGNEINMVSYWLGHAHVNTTHIYTEIDMETKRKMIEKAGAPGVSKGSSWQKPEILKWLDRLAKGSVLCAANP